MGRIAVQMLQSLIVGRELAQRRVVPLHLLRLDASM
jgi:hypothetical protein